MTDNTYPLSMIETACPCCGHTAYHEYACGFDYEYKTSPDLFTFMRCDSCSVLYLNPRPALKELSRIYPTEYEPYHFDKKSLTLYARNWLESRKARFLTKDLTAGARIMDAGCGGIGFLDCLNRQGAGEWELWGNDIDTVACQDISNAGYHAAGGRFEELDLPDQYFDMIILKQVIEHLDKPSAVMAKAYKLLKSGATLVVETPNSDSLDARLFGKGFWGGYHFPRHWTLFDFRNMAKLGEDIGFEIKSIDFMLSPAFWVQSVHHRLQSSVLFKWLARFFSIKNPIPVSFACVLDLLQKALTGTTSNMRIIFSKPIR